MISSRAVTTVAFAPASPSASRTVASFSAVAAPAASSGCTAISPSGGGGCASPQTASTRFSSTGESAISDSASAFSHCVPST